MYLKAVGDEKPGESLKVQGSCWCWSPDGRSSAITADQDNTFTYAIFDLKTKKAKPLRLPEVKAHGLVERWKVAFDYLLRGRLKKPDLYWTKCDGSEAKRIGQSMDDLVSPDGKKVLYLGWKDDETPDKA